MFTSNDQKYFYEFIKAYYKYLLSLTFHVKIYKADLFNDTDLVRLQVESAQPENLQGEEIEIFSKDSQKEKVELWSQALFCLLGVIEGLSKLDSLSMDMEDTDFECVESNIVALCLQDLYYFYGKFYDSLKGP